MPRHNPQDDMDAFAQMQRFTRLTGRTLIITHGSDAVTIANSEYNPVHDRWYPVTGWFADEPLLTAVQAPTFAEVWAKFCAEWPEAGTA
jgi:hypothetical protein